MKPADILTTYMIRFCALTALAATCCVSCVQQPGPYQPLAKPELKEYSRDRLNVYPNDVRDDLDAYTNTPVVWVGTIHSSDAQDEDVGGKIRVETVFDHHYFNWRQLGAGRHAQLSVSQRGEGRFRARWYMVRKYPDAGAADAQLYAARGKLAIFYGVPVSVDPDGTVVLHYHYVRILDESDFTTEGKMYGRLGDPAGLTPMAFHMP